MGTEWRQLCHAVVVVALLACQTCPGLVLELEGKMRALRSRASKKTTPASSSDSEDEPVRPTPKKKPGVLQSPISDSETESYDEEEMASCGARSQKLVVSAKSPVSDSETESEDECHVADAEPSALTPRPGSSGDSAPSAPRSSGRIKEKRSREFHMPSKQKLLQEIPISKSPGKSWEHLQPRKLVNDFTRVTNRYNQEALETSGESSMEDFVVDHPSSVSDYSLSDSDPPPKKHKRSSKKSRHVKAASPSSSSSEGSEATEPTESTSVVLPRQCCSARKRLLESSSSDVQSASDEEAVQIKRTKKQRNNSVIDSDFSDLDSASNENKLGQRLSEDELTDINTASNENQVHSEDELSDLETVSNESNVDTKLSDSDGELPDLEMASNESNVGQRLSDSDPDSESAEMNHNISLSRRRHSKSVDAAEGSEDEDEEDAHTRGHSERAQVMAERKQAKLDLLHELKKAKGRIVDADSW